MNEVIEQETPSLVLKESELIKVLQSSLYPGACLESIKMVLDYCKASRLDPMQKPVHIVPMWDSKAGQMRDVIMPGVNLYRTQAARSGQFAGMSEPEFGPDVTKNIGGVEVTYPEWCRVTVRRLLPSGVVAEFTAIEYWIENYAAKGGKEKSVAPNAMWQKRPRGQLAKCASAQALRIAFPEIASQQTAEEMEGKHIIDMGPAKTTPAEIAAAALPQPAERTDELNNIIFNLEMVAKSEGATALAEEWSMLTKEQRKAIGQDELKRLKELAGEGRANEGGDGDE
ncbi:phage recombination protein Bet [Cupriavidus gilardii]|uniref:Phage recombination protein Bet n=2 Tax=Cupriavidus gilardii TaxID=82541 RepID=A0A849BDJ3_9BURK|nr:phage recombination protein Bet [Cupriavidus gilardii]KAB0593662.1 phage recombination protein Bet [Cupriavidus gilardii]NNH13960.1 phage recombination protein Bet [Cupriavidus gilardii]USE78880.1 phage recombination protein Bet [Cupriavidus gilardii]